MLKGTKHSDLTRLKMRDSHLDKPSVLWTVDRKKEFSELMKRRWANSEFKDKLVQAAIDSHKTKKHGFLKGHEKFTTDESHAKVGLLNTKPKYTKICKYCGKTFIETLNAKRFENHVKCCEHKLKRKNDPHIGDFQEKPSYSAIHVWLFRRVGFAKNYKCVDCGKQAMDWSNVDHKYRRIASDYSPRCRKCHRLYDDVNFR